MKSLDELLKQYAEETAKAVEPAYEEARAGVHKQMRRHSSRVIGVTSSMLLVLAVFAWLVFSIDYKYPTVIVTSESGLGDSNVGQAVEAPAVILNEGHQPAMKVKGDGHHEPVQMYVNHNDEAVETLVAEQKAVAETAILHQDFHTAAKTYFNLAKTLELYERQETAQWAAEQAQKYAQSAADTRLLGEIATFLQSIKH